MTLAGNLFATGAVTITAAATIMVVQPRSSGLPSKGVSGDQSGSLSAARTATAGSTTTAITDTATTPWTASAYVGHVIEGTSGTNNGVRRIITANTNQTLTVDIAFPATMASQTFRILEPDTSMPIVTDYFFNHTAGAAAATLQVRGLVNGTLTTRAIAYYQPGAAATGLGSGTGCRLPGIPGGEITFLSGAAMTGSLTVSGYWANPNQSIA